MSDCDKVCCDDCPDPVNGCGDEGCADGCQAERDCGCARPATISTGVATVAFVELTNELCEDVEMRVLADGEGEVELEVMRDHYDSPDYLRLSWKEWDALAAAVSALRAGQSAE